MTKLNKALRTAIATIPECIAAAYIDLSNGMLLGSRSADPHATAIIEVLAVAIVDLNDSSHFFQEIIANSDNLIHVFLRGNKPDYVACFICSKSANLGMVLTKARSVMHSLEEAV